MSNLPIKRRNVFINKSFQGRFIVWVFMLILLSGLCSALLIYWLTGGELKAQAHTAHINMLSVFEHLGLSIFIGNVVAIFIAGIIAVFVVIIASHKIAGPLYRFEKLCEQVGDGHFDGVTTLREKDQLQELGKSFSIMTAKLRMRQNKQMECIAKINTQIAQIKGDQNVTPQQRILLDELEQAIKQLTV